MNEVYLAAGWFTPEQAQHRDAIRGLFKELRIPHYSPQHNGLKLTKKNSEAVYQENLTMIKRAPLVVASTTGKDMGTLWECGYATAIETPIVYVWLGAEPGQNFNLMLARSAKAVIETVPSLFKYLEKFKSSGIPHVVPYGGDIE